MPKTNTYIEMSNMLKQMHSEVDAPPGIDPEDFLAHLNQQESLRPSHINDILRAFASRYPTNLLILLDAYMLQLEGNQKLTLPSAEWDTDNPPYWSHGKMMTRRKRRSDREMKKILHEY